MTTALPYIIRPIGGTAWSVARGDEHLGTIYAGQPDGEWDEDAIMAAATAGDFPIVDDDGAVIIDGVTVREADAPDSTTPAARTRRLRMHDLLALRRIET